MAGQYTLFEDPKNIEEWFHNRDVEEFRKQQAAFITSMSTIMKEIYSDGLNDLVYNKNPLLAQIPKK